jgi:hypothetical protein
MPRVLALYFVTSFCTDQVNWIILEKLLHCLILNSIQAKSRIEMFFFFVNFINFLLISLS